MSQPSFETIMICEGAQEPPGDTDEKKEAAYFAAWQELIDSGVAWRLQGWFGRTAMVYIASGHCKAPEGYHPPGHHPSDR